MAAIVDDAVSYAKTALGRARWAIAIYTGKDPLALAPAPGVPCPVLTRHDVSDAVASFVADPFMIRVNGAWHMFFETLKLEGGRRFGVISHATSADGRRWQYDRVVLEEEWHLSYPQVFAHGGEVLMLPESQAAGAVRLLRAERFPYGWKEAAVLLREPLLDPTVFLRDGRWWMLAEAREASDTLRLFSAPALEGPWSEHPKSPVVRGDKRASRPAGRVIVTPDRIIRFAQDCAPAYGTGVRAFEITGISEAHYEERPIADGRILGPGEDWNSRGMHHVDAHRLADGSWIACVDGWYRGVVDLDEIRARLRGGQ